MDQSAFDQSLFKNRKKIISELKTKQQIWNVYLFVETIFVKPFPFVSAMK
jgi:hypothetical protein